MTPSLNFPTKLHQQVADLACEFFNKQAQVDTVLVVNSCARGQAVSGSDLDLAVLVKPTAKAPDIQNVEKLWSAFAAVHPLVVQFRRSGRFTHLHVDLFDGQFGPTVWDEGGGPDSFEVEVGNRIAYAAPLHGSGPYFHQLQSLWLPYYGMELHQSRLAMVRAACEDDLDHIPWFLSRGLHFSAFDYLYKAFREFLQALFIARRTYPLSYTKWIREQVANWLALPELYRELPALLSVRNIESLELGEKASALRRLLEHWSES